MSGLHLQRIQQIKNNTNQLSQFINECRNSHKISKNVISQTKNKSFKRYQSKHKQIKQLNEECQDGITNNYHIQIEKQFLNLRISQQITKLCRQKQQTDKKTKIQKIRQKARNSSMEPNRKQQLGNQNKAFNLQLQTQQIKNQMEKQLLYQKQNVFPCLSKRNAQQPNKNINQKCQNTTQKKQTCQSLSKKSSNPFSKERQLFQIMLLNVDLQKITKILKTYQVSKESSQTEIFQFMAKIIKVSNISFQSSQPLLRKYSNCVYFGTCTQLGLFHFGIQYYFQTQRLYIGSMRNFKKNGEGIEFFKHQTNKIQFIIYRGTFQSGLKTGNFVVKHPQYIYYGYLDKGQFQGQGVLTTNKYQFKGLFNNNNKVNGQQKLIQSGIIYTGQFQNNVFNGKGTLKTKQSLYKGNFLNGQKQGMGLQVTSQFIYEGQFANNKKNGFGVILFKNKGKQLHSIQFVQFNNDQIVSLEPLNQPTINQVLQLSLQEVSLKSFHNCTFESQNQTINQQLNMFYGLKQQNKEKIPKIMQTQIKQKPQSYGQELQQNLYYKHQFKYLNGNKGFR